MKDESAKYFKSGSEAARAESGAAHAEKSTASRAEFSAKMSRDEDMMIRRETGGFLEKINKLPKSVKKYAMALGLTGMLLAGYETKGAEAEEQQAYSASEARKISPERQAAWNQFLAQKNAADQSFAQELARINQTYQMRKFEITSRSVQNIFLRQPGSIWQGSREMVELDIWRHREAMNLQQLHDAQVMQARNYFEMRAAGK